MPGTIHVTVLEFKGVSSSSSSSSKPSAKSLKVSMGKRQYQTWDKGDFSFPITKLREDLVVALLDAGGNEIARADIRTMQVMEKGSWDDVFPINGSGNVHMKLQFVLSDEERNRIRIMRESAVKKKLEMNPSINLRLSESFNASRDSVETSTKYEQKVSGKQVIEIVGCDQDEADTHHAKKISSESHSLENLMHGTESEVGNNQKKIVNQPNSSNGLIGQVIKVAVIFGFGVLVLLTRQKEPRKKQRQENKNLFTLPDYIDERTLKPWPTATMKD